jgi:hypothetical protein
VRTKQEALTRPKRGAASALAQISRLACISIVAATCGTGCSGPNPTLSPSAFSAETSHRRVRPLATPNYLYVTNRSGTGGQLLVFPANNPHPTLIRLFEDAIN